MLLCDQALQTAIDKGSLIVSPYDEKRLQPSSIDVTLGSVFCVPQVHTGMIDPKEDNSETMERVVVPYDDYFTLQSHEFVLASTKEIIGLDDCHAARIEGKSSLGRLGLLIHATAGFIDPGFYGDVTLELFNLNSRPIKLYPGMPFAQICVFQMSGPAIQPYVGKYQNQQGPQQSRYHLNTWE